MPRRPRTHLDNVPLHIVQRGHNRERCFFAEDDYGVYRRWLSAALNETDCRLHAYALMTNHVHLLITPRKAAAIPRLMISLGRRYVQYSNTTYRRTGTLWDSRYKSSMIQAETYLLDCMRYIELNPVRAAMVDDPAQYCRSGYRANGLAVTDLACPSATNRTASSLYSSVYDARLLLSLVILWLLFQVIYTRLRVRFSGARSFVTAPRNKACKRSMPNRRASTSGRAGPPNLRARIEITSRHPLFEVIRGETSGSCPFMWAD